MATTWTAEYEEMTQYLYGNLSQPFQITASRDPQGNLTTYYYDDFGALYAFERGGARYYVGSDHLGTPKIITDNTGTIIRQIEYDSWGVKTSDTNPSFDLPVGFAGGIPDDATGLVRFGYRDYEPGTGRWAAKDPIFFRSRQFNLYVYVGNSPINFRDRSGLGPLGNETFEYPSLKPVGDFFTSVLQSLSGGFGGVKSVGPVGGAAGSVGGTVAGTGATLLDPELGPNLIENVGKGLESIAEKDKMIDQIEGMDNSFYYGRKRSCP